MGIDAINGGIGASVALRHSTGANRLSEVFQNEDRKVHKMEYLIVIGVVSMITLYAIIVERCLRDA